MFLSSPSAAPADDSPVRHDLMRVYTSRPANSIRLTLQFAAKQRTDFQAVDRPGPR
jgi:hypothetical protein